MFLIPRSATFAPFFTPIPAISHLLLLIFRLAYFEKISKQLIISIMELSFLTKKLVSSAHEVK